MSAEVVAIVVVRNGERDLAVTLDAVRKQTLKPKTVVVVDSASRDGSLEVANSKKVTHIVTSRVKLNFGEGIDEGVRAAAPGPDALLWLLSHDSAPEPEALQQLVSAMEISPSVGIVGPKLVRWDNHDYIVEMGQTISEWGATVQYVHDELDQGQHDTLNDVMAVAPAGMLVRHQVWSQLDGFDPGLPNIDDALDFCVRARLGGHLVSVAPAARVAFGGSGVAGATESDTWRLKHKRARQARTAQLHRRMAYAPAMAVLVHWVMLFPIAVFRTMWHLIMKTPARIAGEFSSALATALGFASIRRSRQLVSQAGPGGRRRWKLIAPLRMSHLEMRRRRALEREVRVARVKGTRPDLQFFATGGGWVLAGSVVLGTIGFVRLLGAGALTGGALGPMSSGIGELWANAAFGWRDVSVGFVGAADPFTLVLAILGTATFWQPSQVIVLLWFLAMPLAAMSAWFAAARFTERGGIRAMVAMGWAIAPMFLAALADGRPGAVIAHILMPTLVLALVGAAKSWTSTAVAALVFVAVAASSPSLVPVMVLGWLVAMFTAGRGTLRVASIPIPTAVMFAPLAIMNVWRGTWLGVLADPGFPVAGGALEPVEAMMGFPAGSGWGDTLAMFGLANADGQWVTGVLIAPLILVALLALYLKGNRVAVVAAVLGLGGLISALTVGHLQVATTGSEQIPLWAGAALSVYWLGLLGAAMAGLKAFGERGVWVTGVVSLATTVLIVPTFISMIVGGTAVSRAPDREVPAYVAADADSQPRLTTMVLEPQQTGGLRVTVQHGIGQTMDDQSTLAQTDRAVSAEQKALAELAGNLASTGGAVSTEELAKQGVQYVLLTGVPSDDAAGLMRERAAVAMNQKGVLRYIGVTDQGDLWRTVADVEPLPVPAGTVSTAGAWVIGVQLSVLLATLLLALPTGLGQEVAPRRVQRKEVSNGEES